MSQRPTRLDMLRALRARLNLDQGMGVDFAAGTAPDLSGALKTLERARAETPAPARAAASVSNRLRRSESAAPDVPAPRPGRIEPEATPPSPAAPGGDAAFAPRGASLVPPVVPPPHPEKEAALAALREEALRCRACELCAKRNSVVWGEGNLDAAIMFIGEGPGRDEDLEARPFVGRSGRLLTDIIEKGMKIPRDMIYITNVVKCRPPGNRDPKPEETAACFRYLKRQVEVIGPKIIVAVGGVAGCHLLRLPPKSSGLRNTWHQYDGIPLRVIYHPSYLLRQRNAAGTTHTKADKETWEDVKEILAMLEKISGA